MIKFQSLDVDYKTQHDPLRDRDRNRNRNRRYPRRTTIMRLE
jgi:hypothetical protein